MTREVHQFKAPFDEQFRDMVVSTAEHLMNCGFRVVYGYTQSDEISLLFHPEYELPMKDQYGDFILRLIEDSIKSE